MRPRSPAKQVALSVLSLGIWFYIWAYRAGKTVEKEAAPSTLTMLRWSAVLGPIGVLLMTSVMVLSLVIVLDATGVLGEPWADEAAPPVYFWVMMAASLLVNLFWIPAMILVVLGLYRVWEAWQIEDRTFLLVMVVAGAFAFPPLMLVAQWISQRHLDAAA